MPGVKHQVGGSALTLLPAAEWRARAEAHAERADAFTAGWRSRRPRQTPHPVDDFLFTYYPTKPTKLRVWHPGAGVALADAWERAGWRDYRAVAGANPGSREAPSAGADAVGRWGDDAPSGVHPDRRGLVAVDATAILERDAVQIGWIEGLLRRTAERPGRFGCFGLHEWAMVYGQSPDDLRHRSLSLRLGHDGTDAVVESHEIACTHFDAHRFFTPAAEPRNRFRPTRASQPELEQPGCLHAGMDLYKWALRLGPLVPGELLLDAFELARDIRELDMRASPYDVSAYGLAAVAIETPAGKHEYAAAQRHFAQRGDALRHRLLAAIAIARAAAAPTNEPTGASASPAVPATSPPAPRGCA